MRVFRSNLGCMLLIIAVPVVASPHLNRLNEEMAGEQGLKMCTQKTNLLDCPVVTGFYTSILDADYASIGWSDVNPGGGYTFQYGLTGYDYLNPDAGTSFYTENSSKTITGLQFETAYDVYVRSECSNPTTSSEWAGPYTFTTYAEPFCDAPLTCPFPMLDWTMQVLRGLSLIPRMEGRFSTDRSVMTRHSNHKDIGSVCSGQRSSPLKTWILGPVMISMSNPTASIPLLTANGRVH